MCACLAVLLGMLYMKLKCIAMKFEHYKNLCLPWPADSDDARGSGCWGSNILAVSNAS